MVSDAKRLVDTSGVIDVTTKRGTLRLLSEEGALDRYESAGRALTHDVIQHSNGLDNASVVRVGTTEITVEGGEIDDSSESDDHTVLISATRAGLVTRLVVKVDVVTNLIVGEFLTRPGQALTVEDPTLTESGLCGLRVPDSLDQTTLLSTGANLDLILVDGLVRKAGDGEGVQLNVDILAQLGGGLARLKGVTGAASIGPHSGTEINVLDVVGDALDDLRSRSSGNGIAVAIEAGKRKVSSGLSGGWSTALTLSVASGGAEHVD